MINKPVLIWKGIPSNWSEFFKEVFVLWIGTAFLFGMLVTSGIIFIIKIIYDFS